MQVPVLIFTNLPNVRKLGQISRLKIGQYLPKNIDVLGDLSYIWAYKQTGDLPKTGVMKMFENTTFSNFGEPVNGFVKFFTGRYQSFSFSLYLTHEEVPVLKITGDFDGKRLDNIMLRNIRPSPTSKYRAKAVAYRVAWREKESVRNTLLFTLNTHLKELNAFH